MKVTILNILSTKGYTMKKTLFVSALVVGMLFAFASSAFANWGGWTGTTLYDTSAGSPRHSTSYVKWADVISLETSGAYSTPHKGYATDTTLCAVCHSVHYAPVFANQVPTTGTDSEMYAFVPSGTMAGRDNADVTSLLASNTAEIQAEMLLRSEVGTACNYCHIDTAIGVTVVYAGDADIFGYEKNFSNSYAHNYHETGCSDCHSVHGSKTYGGPLASAILKQQPRGRNPQREVIADITSSNPDVPAMYGTTAEAFAGVSTVMSGIDGDRYYQQTAFCSSCHYVYSDGSDRAIKERGGSARFTKHHPMTAAGATPSRAADKGASDGTDGAQSVQWAWVGSQTCRDCHAAGEDGSYIGDKSQTGYSDNSFPHYTAGNYRFLDQASTAEYATDEVCLDCHRAPGNTAGVGVSY